MKARFCQPKRVSGGQQTRTHFNALAHAVRLSMLRERGAILGSMAEGSIEATYAGIRNALVERRRALAEEIDRHPRPITGCDVHFNRLLEERAALSEQIDRLDDLIAGS